jgi:hypothetical protein
LSKKEFELSERSEFSNSRQLREAQDTRRVKWRGCLFLGSSFEQAKEECLLQANKDLNTKYFRKMLYFGT